MKRAMFLFIVFLASSLVTAIGRERQTWNEQPYKYEVRLAYGGPSVASDYIPDMMYSGVSSGFLATLYSANDGPLYATGAITAEFGMTLRKWLTLSLTASATGLWMERYDSYSMDLIGRKNGLTFNLMPQIRLNWVSRPSFKMYSSLGLGMAVCAFAGQTVVSDAFMIVPLGMSIGRRFFFFWETGTGNYNSFTGMNAGFGYRF